MIKFIMIIIIEIKVGVTSVTIDIKVSSIDSINKWR